MSALYQYVNSSIGSKKLMGLTGLGMCGFLLMHMAGNLLVLVSPEAYNSYGHAIVSNPLLYVAEVGLVVFFFIHVIKGITISLRNRGSRPLRYAVATHGEKKTTAVSRTLFSQGVIIFAFIILHLATFKYGAHYSVTYNGVEMRDLYKLIFEVFHSPGYVAWYVIALLVLSAHLGHGFYSSFQSLGLNSPRYEETVRRAGYVYDFVVSAGFIVLPLYVYFHS